MAKLTLVLFLFSQLIFAQHRKVFGVVFDSLDNPITGVNIEIKNTGIKTKTDIKGEYSIRAEYNDTLVFSFSGMKTRIVMCGYNPKINLRLEGINHKEVISFDPGPPRIKKMYYGDVYKLGTKESFKTYRLYLETPQFLDLFEKSKKNKTKSTKQIILNGFSDEHRQRCNFDEYKFREYIEEGGFPALDTLIHNYYVYQNQKIIYKEIWFKVNKQQEKIEVYFNKGKPYSLQSRLAKTTWFFNQNGTIINHPLPDLAYFDTKEEVLEHKVLFLDNSKFTIDEYNKIREDLIKIIETSGLKLHVSYSEYRVKDWRAQNKIKKYLKNVFKTDFDLYLDGISIYEMYFISENGDFYAFTEPLKTNSNSIKIVE